MKKAENSLRTRKRQKIIKIPRKMCDWIIKMDVPLNNKSKYLNKNMGWSKYMLDIILSRNEWPKEITYLKQFPNEIYFVRRNQQIFDKINKSIYEFSEKNYIAGNIDVKCLTQACTCDSWKCLCWMYSLFRSKQAFKQKYRISCSGFFLPI